MTYNSSDVAGLASKILEHKKKYYEGSPEISDQEYDALEERLRRLSPNHPVLSTVGAGDVSSTNLAKVPHAVPMLSLAKTYALSELMAWLGDRKVMATYKIDGNSLSLVYKNGTLTMAKTRGNGRVGENVSEKVSWVSDCVPTLGSDMNVEIRGELYCSDSAFVHLAEQMAAMGLERPTNPRNIVAGVLGRKQHVELARYFNFFAFDVIDEQGFSPFPSESEKFAWLSDHGFTLPPHSLLEPSGRELQTYLDSARTYMAEGDIGIDGVVFSYDDTALHKELGATSHHPRYKMSFKWAGETGTAKISHLQWATSRLGIVTPVAVIDPIYLSGANITNVTLHNAAHVKAYNLKAGDEIEIIRSGEVIPKFLRVVKAVDGDAEFPRACSSCGTSLEFDDVRLTCPNVDGCPSQLLGGIINWIRACEIDDLSEKRLTAMVDLGLVSHVADLYRLTPDDMLKLPLTKEKMATKLLANIEKSKTPDLVAFLTGLGIAGTGRTTWQLVLDRYPKLEDVLKVQKEDLIQIKGFAEKLANGVVEGLKVKHSVIERLLEVGVRPVEGKAAPPDAEGVFSGMTFVITGSLSRPRNEIKKVIESLGGKVSGAVSAKTTAVVTNDESAGSSKLKKAVELGTPIWSEDKLFQEINKK